MSLKNTYKVYITGSLSGTTIHDITKNSAKKFTYIKVKQKKGEQVFYLDRERNLVDASRADTFSLTEAHKISVEIIKSLKDYEVSTYTTTQRLNNRARKNAKEKSIASKDKVNLPRKNGGQPSELLLKHDTIKDPIFIFPAPFPPPQLGTTVLHRKYGEGKIVEFNDKNKCLTVAFAKGKKPFLYPHCFENGFLEKKT